VGEKTQASGMTDRILVRAATEDDLPEIARIYNDAILNTASTFDTEPKTVDQWRELFVKHTEAYPLLVAEADGRVAGWGALRPSVDRPAARFTVENAVYVDRDRQGKGIGSALLAELVERARAAGYHAVVAMVVAGNEASARLHLRLGFEQVGFMREVGRKFGRWLDLVVFERIL
jgi:L-amino acid N-acyltransferase YncA